MERIIELLNGTDNRTLEEVIIELQNEADYRTDSIIYLLDGAYNRTLEQS